MSGTALPINKAMMRPIMIAGVEKRLALLNALLSFPLIAATHFHIPACFFGLGFYVFLHLILRMITKYDPQFGKLFQRSTRYSQGYFPAMSHPGMMEIWKVKSI